MSMCIVETARELRECRLGELSFHLEIGIARLFDLNTSLKSS